MAAAGGREITKYRYVPQTKMASAMPRGTTVQNASSSSEPWIAFGRSASLRRRYFRAKTRTRRKISPLKNTVTATRNRKSASTWPATVEACSGMRRSA